jgi:uncharacterized protein
LILIDAGPLVGLLSDDDQHALRCRNALRELSEPLATVWPCVAEAMHLLAPRPRAQDALMERVESGALAVIELDRSDIPRIRELMRKYAALPIDLADGALVRVAERERIFTIFTTDRRDFELYRPLGRRRFRIIP